ncbi:MAG: GNAT family N-acetyltransferase [Alphaproteobacteria bacterium]|nr:GNAT family N-acetyltransferase [Alphaproteobacteria bacterium]
MTQRVLAAFTTARLLLRPFRPEDIDQAFALFADPEVMKYSVAGADSDRAATEARLARYQRDYERDGFGVFAMVDRGPGRLVGIAGLRRLEHGNEVELIYRLRRDKWGQGFASEAVSALIDRGFRELGLRRIFAFIEPENLASQRAALRVGMAFVEDTLYEGMPVQSYVITNPKGAERAA